MAPIGRADESRWCKTPNLKLRVAGRRWRRAGKGQGCPAHTGSLSVLGLSQPLESEVPRAGGRGNMGRAHSLGRPKADAPNDSGHDSASHFLLSTAGKCHTPPHRGPGRSRPPPRVTPCPPALGLSSSANTRCLPSSPCRAGRRPLRTRKGTNDSFSLPNSRGLCGPLRSHAGRVRSLRTGAVQKQPRRGRGVQAGLLLVSLRPASRTPRYPPAPPPPFPRAPDHPLFPIMLLFTLSIWRLQMLNGKGKRRGEGKKNSVSPEG